MKLKVGDSFSLVLCHILDSGSLRKTPTPEVLCKKKHENAIFTESMFSPLATILCQFHCWIQGAHIVCGEWCLHSGAKGT